MTKKLYVDVKGNRLWEHTFSGGKESEVLNTPYGSAVLQEKNHTEASLVSCAFFLPILWTICPAVEVYRNDKNEYAVMLIQQDSMGSSPTSYISLHGGFCFSEVYAYPKLLSGVKTIQLVMKTTDGLWFSYSLYQAPFAQAGRILFHCNQCDWDKCRNMEDVCDKPSCVMTNLCEEGRHDLKISWQVSKLKDF